MADDELLGRIHDLSDLELAALLSLINQEHCIIDTDPDCLDDLVQELRLVRERQPTSMYVDTIRLPQMSSD